MIVHLKLFAMKNMLQSLKTRCLLLMLFANVARAQTIDSVEYFINTDPGFGKGTGIATTHAADISDISLNINTTPLSNGFNNLYIRSRSSDGHWSLSKRWLFFKDVLPAANINRIEYFVDTDPGFGNATTVSFTPGSDVSNLFWTVDLTVLANGFHNIFVRSRDDDGNWSVTNRWLFFKDIIPAVNVNKLEYFIDNDPGFGNGTNVSITAGADVADVFWTVDVTGLSNGFHNIFMRSKDNAGNWSLTNKWLFFKDILPSANVNKLEYFIDTDPGFGNGTNVTISAGADISDINIPVNTSALSEGFHTIFIRSKDNNGNWAITNRFGFFHEQRPLPLNLKKAEYFFNTDPGFGNGTPITFTTPTGTDIADLSFPADISALANNTPHYLFVRTLDSINKWSLTNIVSFTKSIVVPITWLSFNASLKNKVVQLDWKTSSETNSSHFDIERSTNGFSYEKIGEVKAAGNSNTVSYYDFTDRLPVKGMNYYRLKQVDLDGKYSYSEIRKVEIKTDMPLFVIQNNLMDGSAVIVKTSVSPAYLGIFDMAGRKLKDISILSNNQQVNLSYLPSGTYTVALYKNGSVFAVEKIVIQH